MRKLANLCALLLAYCGSYTVAGVLLRGDLAPLASELSRAMWAVAALIATTSTHLVWKAHEAQEAKGLDMDQLLRVRRVARLIGIRGYLLSAAAIVAAVSGIVGSTPTLSMHAPWVAKFAVGTMGATVAIWLVWLPLLHADLQKFQGRAHEMQMRRDAATELAQRLREKPAG